MLEVGLLNILNYDALSMSIKMALYILCVCFADGRSCYPELSDGGALQISVHGFQVDYFPFHWAKTNRAHWPKYAASHL